MLVIDVGRPLQTDERYVFECRVSHRRSLRARLRHVRTRTEPATRAPDVVRFGFRTHGWRLEHHPVWDAIYPLMALTRVDGPLFDTRHHRAVIRMGHAIPTVVRDFYVRRAHDLGSEVTIEARSSDATFDGVTDRHVLAFGGGKESRTILGMLRETGRDPLVVSSWERNVPDLPSALVSEPSGLALVDRLMPALMQRGGHLYVGGTLGGSHRVSPWHRYYDMGAPAPLRETADLLGSLGLPMTLHAPLAVAPPNIGQWVLHDRYPDLHRFQQSVRAGAVTDKNLHVALCRLHHGIAHHEHCPPELFERLLERFVRRERTRPAGFGRRREREVISREMRAIIHRHRDEPPFEGVRDQVPDDWAGDWIDYLHPEVERHPDPGMTDVLLGYARPVSEAPPGARLWPIPV